LRDVRRSASLLDTQIPQAKILANKTVASANKLAPFQAKDFAFAYA
jgi:hypothetical protein